MFRPMTAAVTVCLALGLAGAARAQDEIVSTRPAAIQEGDVPAPPPPAPPPPAPPPSPVEDAAPVEWSFGAQTEGGYARSRIFLNDPVLNMTPEPLPDWALEEPVRYVAEMCRPGVRPEGEEIETCFTRVEHAVNEARRAAEAASRDRAPRRACSQQTRRSQDGAVASSSYICTTGEGDPAQMEALLFGD